MTRLPGAPRGNTFPPARPGTPVNRVRHVLAALLLTVLTLAVGAPASAGAALPARVLSGAGPVAAYALDAPSATPGTPRPTAVVAADPDGTQAAAVPPPVPRAGSDRTHTPHHFPPPGQGALLPRGPGLPVPRALPQRATGLTVLVPDRTSAASPGVRGPPAATGGLPAAHRSCSTDLPSVPR